MIANSSDNWLGLVLSVLGVIYLLCVLVCPERF